MWIKKKIIDIQGFNFATVCLPRKHKVSPITTPRRLVQCCSWKVWVVWQPAFTSRPQCGKSWFLYFRPLDGDKTEIRGWRQGCLKDDSSRNSFDVGKSDEASLTACTGSTAGGLWSLDIEGPGFDSVTEYLSSWAWGKRRGQLELHLNVPLKWGWPVVVSIFRCGRNKENHDNHDRLKPLPSFSKYSVISQNSCMILDGEDLPPITGGRTPFLQNHIALNFLLTLLGEGRLEPKPN